MKNQKWDTTHQPPSTIHHPPVTTHHQNKKKVSAIKNEIHMKNGAARPDPREFKNSIPPKLKIPFNFVWEFPLKFERTKKEVTQTEIPLKIFPSTLRRKSLEIYSFLSTGVHFPKNHLIKKKITAQTYPQIAPWYC